MGGENIYVMLRSPLNLKKVIIRIGSYFQSIHLVHVEWSGLDKYQLLLKHKPTNRKKGKNSPAELQIPARANRTFQPGG